MPTEQEKTELMRIALGPDNNSSPLTELRESLQDFRVRLAEATLTKNKHYAVLELFEKMDMEDRKRLVHALVHEDNLFSVGDYLAGKYFKYGIPGPIIS